MRFVFPGEEYYVREVIDFSDGGVYLCRVVRVKEVFGYL